MEDPSILSFLRSLLFRKFLQTDQGAPFPEEELLQAFERVKELEVRDFLIPRIHLKGLDINLSWQEIKEYVITYTHHYYPVYRGTLDHYLGYVSLRDLVPGFKGEVYNWQDFIHPALTIPEGLSITAALEKFRQGSLQLAFVVDEFSEFVGIIRFKDIMEDLFLGVQKCFKADPEGWIELPATTKLRIMERCYQIEFPKGDYETLAGFILDNLKRIPKKGERFTIPPLEVEILEADERKIDKLRIKILS